MEKPFITFEGIDGSGKDTNLIEVAKEIKEDGNDFLGGNKYSTIWITREPSRLTESGRKIARLIREREVSPIEATKGFIEDRIELGNEYIRPIKKHSYTLSSRGDMSTYLYQMIQGLSFDKLYKMHKYDQPNGAVIPDLTVVFTISVTEAMKRMSQRDSVKEIFEERNFQEKVARNVDYCVSELRKYDGRDIILVNSQQKPSEVRKEMIKKMQDWYTLSRYNKSA